MQLSHVAVGDTTDTRPSGATPHHRGRLTRIALAATASALASVSFADPALAAHGHVASPSNLQYNYTTVDNPGDLTFNQLLGINTSGEISGYFGSGAAGHPNQGYLTSSSGLTTFTPENYPESTQTQVTGLNDRGLTVGFWSDTDNGNGMDANFGFWSLGGHFHTVIFPTGNPASPEINQLLGVNDSDVAVGFYNDSSGNSHGYTYNILTDTYHEIKIAGATSVTATAINNHGDVAGYFTDSKGTHAFILSRLGLLRVLNVHVPDVAMTQVFGINDDNEVVGDYTLSSGQMYGFTWSPSSGFELGINDPGGVGTTTLNGINDAGDIVGFYVDSNNYTDGMLAIPGSSSSS